MRAVSTQREQRCLETIRFGEYLFEQSLITEEELLCALGEHWSNGGRIGAAIARLGMLDEAEVERQASAYHGLDTVVLRGRDGILA